MDTSKKDIKPEIKIQEIDKKVNNLSYEIKNKEKVKKINEQKEMTCTLISGDINYII